MGAHGNLYVPRIKFGIRTAGNQVEEDGARRLAGMGRNSFRRLAEEAREVRDHHCEAIETVRQERERLRETAESVRIAGEDARVAAETARAAIEEARVATDAARQAVVGAVRAIADALNASLEHMRVVEDMRRTLCEITDVNKVDSNQRGQSCPQRYSAFRLESQRVVHAGARFAGP
jgi:hypothetical protein